MKLITPKGLTTWARALSSSTIDLAFLSEALTESITSCKVNDKLICGSDHMPIQTILDIPVQAAVPPKPQPQWKKVNWQRINDALEQELSKISLSNSPSPSELDGFAEAITTAIQHAINALVLRARPSAAAKPYWTPACTTAVNKARKARRQWTRRKDEESWQLLRAAKQAKKA